MGPHPDRSDLARPTRPDDHLPVPSTTRRPGPLRRFGTAVRRVVRPGAGRPARPHAGATGQAVDGIAVAYAPHPDGAPDPGEVVWAWVPYEDDPNQGKDRPVLVIGWDGERLAGVPLSSKDPAHKRDASTRVAVGTGAWDRERRPSWADADRVLRFAPHEVRREGSSIDRARFDAVVTRIRELHGP
jgi:hypothetical protein